MNISKRLLQSLWHQLLSVKYSRAVKNGQDVAVKIKREGIDEVIKADLLILQDLVNFLEQRNDIISNLQPKSVIKYLQRIHYNRALP